MRRSAKYFLTVAAALAAPLGLLAAVTPGASAATGVTATFTKTQDWGSGYQATYTITNNTSADLSSWTITFGLPSGQQMGTYWDATETASSNPYTFVNRSYNGDVPANGGTVSFGFIVSYSGTFAPPTNCTVNGGPCGGGGGGGGISAPSGLTVTGTTPSSVSLSWQPVSNADNYLVLKNGTQATSTSSTSATVTGLAASTTYTFTVEAQDSAGDTSPQSSPVTASTQSGGGGGGGGFAVAPYVDMTNNQEGMLDQAAQAGLKAFTASFVIGSGCTPIWGDTLPVTNDPTVTGDIPARSPRGRGPSCRSAARRASSSRSPARTSASSLPPTSRSSTPCT